MVGSEMIPCACRMTSVPRVQGLSSVKLCCVTFVFAEAICNTWYNDGSVAETEIPGSPLTRNMLTRVRQVYREDWMSDLRVGRDYRRSLYHWMSSRIV